MNYQTWMDDAACAGTDPAAFFPENLGSHHGHVARIAEIYCDRCPVADQCLKYGLQIKATAGIFGGQEFITNEAKYARRHRLNKAATQ